MSPCGSAISHRAAPAFGLARSPHAPVCAAPASGGHGALPGRGTACKITQNLSILTLKALAPDACIVNHMLRETD